MRQRTRLLLNSASQVAARFIRVLSRFVLVPYTIGVLGRSYWGAWVLVGQILAYTNFLEAGLKGAVARNVAIGAEKGDSTFINNSVQLATSFFLTAALIIFLLTTVITVYFPFWFEIPREGVVSSRWMVVVSGIALAFSVAQYAYTSVLAGLQREFLTSLTQIGGDVLKVILIFTFLSSFSPIDGMAVLAIIYGGVTLVETCARSVFAFRVCGGLKLGWGCLDLASLKEHAAFGLNTVTYTLSLSVIVQIVQVMIGAIISKEDAADFRVAMELILGAHAFVVAGTLSLRVAASRYDAANNLPTLRRLLLRSSRYAGAVTMDGVVLIWIFAPSFLFLWLGTKYAEHGGPEKLMEIARTVRILVVGFAAFWLSLPAFNIANGLGRHRVPARMALVAIAVAVILTSIVLARAERSIVHVALVVIMPMIPVSVVLLPLCCCRVVHQPLLAYFVQGLGIPIVAAIPVAVMAQCFVAWWPVHTWYTLLEQGVCCALLGGFVMWGIVLLQVDKRYFVDLLRRNTYHGETTGT